MVKDESQSQWLDWAREIQALAQTSLHYAKNPFEETRAERLREIAAEIVVAHSASSIDEVIAAFSAQPGYVTPKVDVRAGVFKGHEILLVREAIDGGWTLPGGWADVGEPPSLAIEREVLEESGLSVIVQRLVGVYDANRIEEAMSLFHAYKMVFLCELVSGEIKPSVETTEVGYFPVDELPEPFSPNRTTPRHIQDLVAALEDPSWSVVFD